MRAILLIVPFLAGCGEGRSTATTTSSAAASAPASASVAIPTAPRPTASATARATQALPAPTGSGFAAMIPEAALEAYLDLGNPPSEDTWGVARDEASVGVPALKCTLRIIDKWLRAVCASADMPVVGAAAVRGARAGQTKVEVRDGALVVTMPFVEGAELIARVDLAKERRFVVLAWDQARRPDRLARIEENR